MSLLPQKSPSERRQPWGTLHPAPPDPVGVNEEGRGEHWWRKPAGASRTLRLVCVLCVLQNALAAVCLCPPCVLQDRPDAVCFLCSPGARLLCACDLPCILQDAPAGVCLWPVCSPGHASWYVLMTPCFLQDVPVALCLCPLCVLQDTRPLCACGPRVPVAPVCSPGRPAAVCLWLPVYSPGRAGWCVPVTPCVLQEVLAAVCSLYSPGRPAAMCLCFQCVLQDTRLVCACAPRVVSRMPGWCVSVTSHVYSRMPGCCVPVTSCVLQDVPAGVCLSPACVLCVLQDVPAALCLCCYCCC